MAASKKEKLSIIRDFFEWLPDEMSLTTFTNDGDPWNHSSGRLIDSYASEILTECDTAIGHGPGHQSISVCILTGPHTEHVSGMGHEWYDSDIGKQIYKIYNYDGPLVQEDGRRTRGTYKTYRLAFE